MNILLINHYAGSPELGMEFRPFYLAKEWIKQGHQVYILASTHSHIRAKNPDFNQRFTLQELEGINYIWLKTPKYDGNGISRVKNIVSFLFYANQYASKISEISKPDLVIASSTYPADNFLAHRLAKKNKAKHIYEVHDLWPLSPIELGGMSKNHPFIVWMQMAENYAYRKADYIVSMLPNTIEHMISHGMDKRKWHFIPNGFVSSDWENPEKLSSACIAKVESIKSDFDYLIGYTGGLGISNAMDNFLNAAKRNHRSNIAFIIVGIGPEKDRLVERQRAEGISNLFFLDAVPKGHIPSMLSLFDLLYIGWKPHSLYRFGIAPNKLIDYMMAGKPIIHANNASNDLVGIADCGLSIEPDNVDKVNEAIDRLINMPENELAEMGERGRVYAQKHHDYEVLAQRFIKIAEQKNDAKREIL